MWKSINSIYGKTNSETKIDRLWTDNDNEIIDKVTIANHLNNYYSDLGQNYSNKKLPLAYFEEKMKSLESTIYLSETGSKEVRR